jgi:hypothetical protein
MDAKSCFIGAVMVCLEPYQCGFDGLNEVESKKKVGLKGVALIMSRSVFEVTRNYF